MSDWGADDYEPVIEAQPIDVNDVPAISGPAGVEPPEVADARATLEDALAAHARTTTQLDHARDALADAEGVLRVAEAKVTDYEDDETMATWQRVAAAVAVEQAGADGTPALYYGSVDEFVREYLRNVYRRHIAAAGSTGSGQPSGGSTTRQ
ncbi:hypothetical protein NKG05_30630 [Oerskovia sp. M15]